MRCDAGVLGARSVHFHLHPYAFEYIATGTCSAGHPPSRGSPIPVLDPVPLSDVLSGERLPRQRDTSEWPGLAVQLLWVLIAYACARAAWARGIRNTPRWRLIPAPCQRLPHRQSQRRGSAYAEVPPRHASVYRALWKNSVTRELMFKTNFLLWVVVELLWFGLQLSFIGCSICTPKASAPGQNGKWCC